MAETLSPWEVFWRSVLSGLSTVQNSITVYNVIIVLIFAFLIGMFIYFTYRKTFRGVLYSMTYGLSLVLLTMISALITMCIKSNLQLSLGMVGALSIVRFRTAVKDPMDTVYMFWSLTMGIVLGAGYYLFALVGALVIGIVMFVLTLARFQGVPSFLLVVHYDHEVERDVMHMLSRIRHQKLKSKTMTRAGVEMTMEIRLPNDRTDLVHNMLRIEGVHDATLVSYQSDIS